MLVDFWSVNGLYFPSPEVVHIVFYKLFSCKCPCARYIFFRLIICNIFTVFKNTYEFFRLKENSIIAYF